jgi:hypothetical protein
MMPKPLTLEEFLLPPTKEAWESELAAGWKGSDGSSISTDDIQGIRVGITSNSYKYSNLPASRHDFCYHLGRKYKLPSKYRKEADKLYRNLCLKLIKKHLMGFSAWKGRQQAKIRYRALRLFGRRAWREKLNERTHLTNS